MAQSGNGIDLAAIYQLLTEISGRLNGYEAKLNELVGSVNEHNRRFDRIGLLLDDFTHGQTEIREALSQYHYSVVGQGLAVNSLAERVKLIEEHLGLASSGL